MSDVSNEKLDELEKLARAATPGRWKHGPYSHAVGAGNGRCVAQADASADAAYIAAADPPTVLALIAELRRRRGEG